MYTQADSRHTALNKPYTWHKKRSDLRCLEENQIFICFNPVASDGMNPKKVCILSSISLAYKKPT